MRIFGSTDQMEVVLDTDRFEISIIQRWKCDFLTLGRHTGHWTENEKRTFCNRICRTINETWGNKAYVQTSLGCSSKFAQTYNGKKFIINPQIEFIEENQHWTAKIYKGLLNKSEANEAWVHWAFREMHMTSNAITPITYSSMAHRDEAGVQHTIVAHEYGHTIGNIAEFNMGDEYIKSHPMYYDKLSIMNHGSEIRTRHFRHIRKLLKEMCPETSFEVRIR